MHFYNDEYRNFVHYALSNLNRLYYGLEFGLEAKLHPNLTLKVASSIGNYTYTSKAIISSDNTPEILAKEEIYIKNYKIA